MQMDLDEFNIGVDAQREENTSDIIPQPRESLVEYLAPITLAEHTKNQTQRKKSKKSNQIVDVLNSILPPQEFKAPDSQTMIRKVSPTPSSRDSVITLQMKLDERLQERQARENGICPVREELYSQCYDELLRQVTIESPERGLLLLRVRDEVRMAIAAYQTLYQSSITFGMRKALQAEQGQAEMRQKIEELQAEKRELEAQVRDLHSLYESIDKRTTEQRSILEKKHTDEIDFLKTQAQNLEMFLKNQKGNN